MRMTSLGLAYVLGVLPLQAAPVSYDLQPEASTVAFEADFGQQVITGSIPLREADLVLDFERLANCRIDVVLNAARAGASFPFAAEALKGKTVLNTADFPEMTFRSTAVQADGDGARVKGELTMRGVTRPVALQARIFRQKGTEVGDRSRLTVQLTGVVKRSDFGATGFADMVADQVRIVITARIIRHD